MWALALLSCAGAAMGKGSSGSSGGFSTSGSSSSYASSSYSSGKMTGSSWGANGRTSGGSRIYRHDDYYYSSKAKDPLRRNGSPGPQILRQPSNCDHDGSICGGLGWSQLQPIQLLRLPRVRLPGGLTFDLDGTAKNARLQSAPMGNIVSSAGGALTDIARSATTDAGSSTRTRRRQEIPSHGSASAYRAAAFAIRTSPRTHVLTRAKASRERRSQIVKSSRVAPRVRTTTML